MYSSDAVNGSFVGRLEASGVEYRLGSWYEGYAAWDVGNFGLRRDMHEERACTEASEQQVQSVGEGRSGYAESPWTAAARAVVLSAQKTTCLSRSRSGMVITAATIASSSH